MRAATILAERGTHVVLDLDESGRVEVTISARPGDSEEDLRHGAGHLANLLLADLAERKLDAETLAVRNLQFARALDGALPRSDGDHQAKEDS